MAVMVEHSYLEHGALIQHRRLFSEEPFVITLDS
jgi:hypothetical protein